ncbi:MAG TPA: TIM barrel protein [Roseiflexaceae bacterium]|nr:TIM barrel protein [Roseiflexaceae bacterium]
MARIKQSVAWWCFVRGDMTPERLVRTAAEIGYQGIDLAPPEYWPLIREHGLTIAAANGHQSISDGLNRREHHDRIEQELLANIRLAEQWRIANLICFSGDRNGLDDATGLEICAEGLRRVAPAAEAAGVNLSVELLNSKVDHPDYQCDHTDWGVQLVKLVDSPRVALLYDIYHMQIMEGDIIRTIKAAISATIIPPAILAATSSTTSRSSGIHRSCERSPPPATTVSWLRNLFRAAIRWRRCSRHIACVMWRCHDPHPAGHDRCPLAAVPKLPPWKDAA